MARLGDMIADYVPEGLHRFELQTLQFFNPSVGDDLSALPARQWPMTRLEESALLTLGYLAFVLIGKFALKGIPGEVSSKNALLQVFMVLYNLTQVALCAYMMCAALLVAFDEDYSFLCNAFSLKKTTMASVTWVFYMSKILDFVDTVFIVARRKWRQLSFLHVYHHSSIFMFYWLNVNVAGDGDVYYTIVVNSFIHLVMYSYYACTTVGVTVPKPIKRAVTHLQRIQFVSMVGQAAYLLYNSCAFPPRITITYAVYIISLFVLFTNFDRKTYGKPAAKKE